MLCKSCSGFSVGGTREHDTDPAEGVVADHDVFHQAGLIVENAGKWPALLVEFVG
jgi:hypothetical protein